MSKQYPIPKIEGFTKVETESFMRAMLKCNDEWAKQACVKLFRVHQTNFERKNHRSSGHNGMGFSRMDAPYLSMMALMVQSKSPINKKQIEKLKNIMSKYARQMIALSDLDKLVPQLKTYYMR